MLLSRFYLPAAMALPIALAPSLSAQQASLKVGDPAPALDVQHWIKGEPVTGFTPGQAYAVEFWATWCPPCKTSMPHLTALQEELGDRIVVIGLSDESLEVAKGFLDQPEWADKTRYTLGTDPDRSVYADYMDASGQMGIPTTFLVDGEGRIAWIGHPDMMRAPLEKMLGVELASPAPGEVLPEDDPLRREFLSTEAAKPWIEKASAAVTADAMAWDFELAASILIGMSATDLQAAQLKKKGFVMRAGEHGTRQEASSFFEMPGLPVMEEDRTTIVLKDGIYYVDQETSSPMMGEMDGYISVEDALMMKEKFRGPYDIPLQGLMFDPNPISADPGFAFDAILAYCSLDLHTQDDTMVVLRGFGSPLLDMNTMMSKEDIPDSVPVELQLDAATGRPLYLCIGEKPDKPSFSIRWSAYREVQLEDPSTIVGDFADRNWNDLRVAIKEQMEMMQQVEAGAAPEPSEAEEDLPF